MKVVVDSGRRVIIVNPNKDTYYITHSPYTNALRIPSSSLLKSMAVLSQQIADKIRSDRCIWRLYTAARAV